VYSKARQHCAQHSAGQLPGGGAKMAASGAATATTGFIYHIVDRVGMGVWVVVGQ